MAELKKYDLTGKQLGVASVDDKLLDVSANSQMIKDYLVALRNNARQWSANTKTRAEVCHSGQKPHPQKGTGNARQGYLGAPQYKGGGRVHAPRPKFDQHVCINKREKRQAIRFLLSQKIKNGGVHLLQVPTIKEPKTRKLADFLKELNLEGKRVLFLAEGSIKESTAPSDKYQNLMKSLGNIPRVQFSYFPNVSGYHLALYNEIVVLESALDELMITLGGK